MHVEMLDSLNALEAMVPAWRALDEQTFPRLPFTGPRWNFLWWETLRREAPNCSRSDLQLRRVRPTATSLWSSMTDDVHPAAGHWAASRPPPAVLRRRSKRDRGAGPCCRRNDEGRVFEALMLHLEAQTNEWDWVELSGFVEQGAAYRCSG